MLMALFLFLLDPVTKTIDFTGALPGEFLTEPYQEEGLTITPSDHYDIFRTDRILQIDNHTSTDPAIRLEASGSVFNLLGLEILLLSPGASAQIESSAGHMVDLVVLPPIELFGDWIGLSWIDIRLVEAVGLVDDGQQLSLWIDNLVVDVVPEPNMVWLLALSLGGLVVWFGRYREKV